MVSLSALKIYEADFLKYDTFVKSSLVILMIVIFLQSSKKLAHNNNASRQKDAKKYIERKGPVKNYLPENEAKLSPIDTAFSFMHATVFENHRKSLIQHCERSELRLYFEWTKVHQKSQKSSF